MPTFQSSRWMFTLNNYTDDEQQRVVDFLSGHPHVKYGTFGRETAPTTGTPHLQGFVIFVRGKSLAWVRQRLVRCHLEPAASTSERCRTYCQKDGDFLEYGTFPSNGGTRTDLHRLFQWSDGFTASHGRAPNSPEIAREFPVEYTRYSRISRTLFNRTEPAILETGDLRAWQSDLYDAVQLEADDRTVTFVTDNQGNRGKSWFMRWLYTKHPDKVQILGVGKRDDIAHCVSTDKSIFLFNVPRGSMEYLQYSILESLKDRVIFSPKYTSVTKIFNHKNHVIVFSNEHPDMTKMSADRYNIVNLDGPMQLN